MLKRTLETISASVIEYSLQVTYIDEQEDDYKTLSTSNDRSYQIKYLSVLFDIL